MRRKKCRQNKSQVSSTSFNLSNSAEDSAIELYTFINKAYAAVTNTPDNVLNMLPSSTVPEHLEAPDGTLTEDDSLLEVSHYSQTKLQFQEQCRQESSSLLPLSMCSQLEHCLTRPQD